MENKDLIRTKHAARNDLKKDDMENMLDGIGLWASFYRENPGNFCVDYLEIDIHPFQHFLLYELMHNYQAAIIATRGLRQNMDFRIIFRCLCFVISRFNYCC